MDCYQITMDVACDNVGGGAHCLLLEVDFRHCKGFGGTGAARHTDRTSIVFLQMKYSSSASRDVNTRCLQPFKATGMLLLVCFCWSVV